MKLSRDEEVFLRHWIHDEARYEQGQGEAKRLQLAHHVRPSDLAVLIAAAMPEPAEQLQAASGSPPAEPVCWPWTEEAFNARLDEARRWLGLPGAQGVASRGA
jgi:hypothetical protein